MRQGENKEAKIVETPEKKDLNIVEPSIGDKMRFATASKFRDISFYEMLTDSSLTPESKFIDDNGWGYFYLWGANYDPRFRYSNKQREKIINYNYIFINTNGNRIFNDYLKISFPALEHLKQSDKRKDIKEAITQFETIRSYNRVQLVNELWDCNQRARTSGFLWGATMASFFNRTIFRNIGIGKKGLVMALSIHACITIGSLRVGERMIDPLAKFALMDEVIFKAEETKENEGIEEFGKALRTTKGLTALEREKLKKIREEKEEENRRRWN